jgi:hypothetical protein
MNSPTEAVRFGPPLRDWQRQVAAVRSRFMVLALHRRAGKTELALKKLLNAAVKAQVELPMFFYVAPYLKQAKAIAWVRLKQLVAPLVPYGQVEINESELWVRFTGNGATVRIFGADNPNAMRGNRLDGVVIDEVADIKPETWEDILMPTLADRKGFAWFIGTPKGINLFSKLFFGAREHDDWHAAIYTVYDTDALDPVEVERMRKEMSETSFAREMLCDFAAAGDDQLISLSDVEAAAQRTVQSEQYIFAPRILGVDPARFGDDRSVIAQRQGLAMVGHQVYRGIDNMDLAARVAVVITDWQPDAVFIDAGAGSGVIDRLRQLGHEVIEVPFGGKASDPGYLNKRAEMWFGMADWLRAGGKIPNLLDLKQDLAAPTYWFDAQGRRQLEPKEDIKKRGLASPDIADALALTFAHPVAPKHHKPPGRALAKDRRTYDPFATL